MMQDKVDFCKRFLNEKDIKKVDLLNYPPIDSVIEVITELVNQGYSIADIGKSLYEDNPDYIKVISALGSPRTANVSIEDYYGLPQTDDKLIGCDSNFRLLYNYENSMLDNHYFNYIVENQINYNRYLVIVRYVPNEEGLLGNMQSIVVEAMIGNCQRHIYAPFTEGVLKPIGFLMMGILIPEILPVIIHLVLEEGKGNTDVLKDGVNEGLYRYTLDLIPCSVKELDYHKDVESHILGTCGCLKH